MSLNKYLFISKLAIILTILIFTNQGYTTHSKAHIHQCIHNAQRTYFVSLDRERTKLVRGLKDCRQNITTVDNHLRCLNSTNTRYRQAVRTNSARYKIARKRCNGLRIQIRKDFLIYKPIPLRR